MSALTPLRVLVVDDSAADRLMAVRTLRRAFKGVVLQEVSTEAEWDRALEQGWFDLALLDYHLPWADGLELLRRLHQRLPGIPVIMLTGTTSEETLLEAVPEGLEEYLPKTLEAYEQLPRTARFALERGRQRRALLESRETLQLVIEGVKGHAIFVVDAQGRISSWNAGAQAVTGYGEPEVLGKPFRLLLAPDELEVELPEEQLEEAARTGHVTGEGWWQRKDGSRFWADVTMSALHHEDGGLRGYALVVRDATERRRTEEFRERLLGVVGHDLRGPLQAILLQARGLHRTQQPEAVDRGATRITVAAERMERLIRDLLDLTRSRLGGGIPVQCQHFDLFALVREVTEEVELVHHGSGRVRMRVEGDGHGAWDPGRLTQVVQNLLGNALKYGTPGSPVEVRLRGVPDGVLLSVHNDGPPIPEDLLPHLFDPFRRGEGHRDRGLAQGLGLGLYIAHEIVRAHGGSIEVASSQAEGTRFEVRLPRRAPPCVSAAAEDSP